MYADADYIMFYNCFAGAPNQPCPKEFTEVALYGKSREITKEKRAEILSVLLSLCIDPSDMKETEVLGLYDNL